MTIQRYRPYSLMDDLQREMSSLLQVPATETNFSHNDWTQMVHIQENTDSYIIQPGLLEVKAADIAVTA
jgi:HSP20 family protein